MQYIVNNMTITKFPIPWMLSSALWSIPRLFKDHRWVLQIGPCWNSSRCWSQQTCPRFILRSPSCCLQGVSLDPPYVSYLMDQWKWPHRSLNDQLLVGPTVHPPLNDVLIRFRKHVLTIDVSKMYRAVTLAPEDRDLWRDIYWPNRGLLNDKSHLWNCKCCILRDKLPPAAKAVKKSFYVEDGLSSLETKQRVVKHVAAF